MTIGDCLRFPKSPSTGYSAGRKLPESMVLTSEAGGVLSTVLEQFAEFGSSPNGTMLLHGDLGVDRSDFLSYLECLLADPDYPFWDSLLEWLGLSQDVRPKKSIRTLFVTVPEDPTISLSDFLLEALARESQASFPASTREVGPDAFVSAVSQISARMAQQSFGMIVLESISERIDKLDDAERHQHELQVYRLFSKLLSQKGILTVLVGKEEHLQIEPQPDAVLDGDREEFEHSYSWIEFENRSSLSPVAADRDMLFRDRIQFLIYDWIQSEIPLWRPERTHNYSRVSQALATTIPDGDKKIEGTVYFKSVHDPYWSDEDLARLQTAAPKWILMVLSPQERFYEFETRLNEIASRMPMLMIWRPDTPSKSELEILRELTIEMPAFKAEAGPAGEEFLQKIRPVFASLYIERGRLISTSGQRAIRDAIETRSISQYISACLYSLQTRRSDSTDTEVNRVKPAGDSQARHWAVLLTGNADLRESSIDFAQSKLIEWLTLNAEGVSKDLSTFPETFQTTRFWGEIKSIETPLRLLRTVLYSLRTGSFSFFEAIDHIGRNFSWEEERLLKWKQTQENLTGIIRWLPSFNHARAYLESAFQLGRDSIDRSRESLLEYLQEPHRFLETKTREEFDEQFLEFKKSYIDSYFLLHEDALHVMNGLKKDELKVDPVDLRNLDLLSGLQYTDKSYLNRVKLLAKWIQHNQCNLPLHQILEVYPRCYCNFNPGVQQHPAALAAEINNIIKQGLEYFRSILRKCGHVVMMDIRNQPIDDNSLKQINAILSDGPMIPLKAQCIKILNRIIVKNSSEFLAEIRKASVKTANG